MAQLNAKNADRKSRSMMSQNTTPAEADQENSLRPQSLADYIGQGDLKTHLAISLEASLTRNEPLDHALFYGPPGLGKTSLAMVIAEEMKAKIHFTSAPALERPRDVVGLLMNLDEGDILFIDEIHRLNSVTEEILYPAMEDASIDRTVGKGASARTLRVPLPKFTLIGATTKAGALSSPLRDRFGLIFRLNYYSPEELQAIILRSANILNVQVDEASALVLGKRSRGTPRIANRLLRRVRDVAEVLCKREGIDAVVDDRMVEEALRIYQVDELGLEPSDRLMLSTMRDFFQGGPVGLEAVASTMGEDVRTLEDVTEPFLLQSGLIQRTPRGRQLTPRAYEHLGWFQENL
ncbi:MAG: Holliday junction branch migration DNA helicase RuvB [Vampirovibrionales bacterium]